MHAQVYRNAIEHAVATKDEETLDALALHLASCEIAKQVLRVKGYGTNGETIDAMARRVPPNTQG